MGSTLDISGKWYVSSTWTEPWTRHTGYDVYEVIIDQTGILRENGIVVEVVMPNGNIVKDGILSGDELVIQAYSYQEWDGEVGTTTVKSTTVRFSENGKSGTSVEKWEWRNDSDYTYGRAKGHWRRQKPRDRKQPWSILGWLFGLREEPSAEVQGESKRYPATYCEECGVVFADDESYQTHKQTTHRKSQ